MNRCKWDYFNYRNNSTGWGFRWDIWEIDCVHDGCRLFFDTEFIMSFPRANIKSVMDTIERLEFLREVQ